MRVLWRHFFSEAGFYYVSQTDLQTGLSISHPAPSTISHTMPEQIDILTIQKLYAEDMHLLKSSGKAGFKNILRLITKKETIIF